MAVVLRTELKDDAKSGAAAAAIKGARSGLTDPAFLSRCTAADVALYEQRIRVAENALAAYRMSNASFTQPAMIASANAGGIGPQAAAAGVLALLAAAFTVVTNGNGQRAEALDQALRALGDMHRQILQRPVSIPAAKTAPSAPNGSQTTSNSIGQLIGNPIELQRVSQRVERDIVASGGGPRCSGPISNYREARIQLLRGLQNRSFVRPLEMMKRVQAFSNAVFEVYKCLGMKPPEDFTRKG